MYQPIYLCSQMTLEDYLTNYWNMLRYGTHNNFQSTHRYIFYKRQLYEILVYYLRIQLVTKRGKIYSACVFIFLVR